MLLLALLAQALEFDVEAKTKQSAAADPELVSTFIESYNMQCWQSNCMDECISCSEKDPKCRDHFLCPYEPSTCFKDVKWSDLSQHEVTVFNCAKKNNCVPSDTASFIEVKMSGTPPAHFAAANGVVGKLAAASAVAKATLPAFAKADANSATPILDATLHTLNNEMQGELSGVTAHAQFAVTTEDRLDKIHDRLAQLKLLKAPTDADYTELSGLIAQLGQLHEAQNQQFEEFSDSGVSSMLETGATGPSRLLHMLRKMADLHAPAEAVETMLGHITGVKKFDPAAEVQKVLASHLEFDGNANFHPDNPAITGTPESEAPETSADGAETSGIPAANGTETAATDTTTQSPEELEEIESQKVQDEVKADEAEYFAPDDALPTLAEYKKNPKAHTKDVQAIDKDFDAIGAQFEGLDDVFVGEDKDPKMGTHDRNAKIANEWTAPNAGADPTSFAQVGAKTRFSLAEVEHAAGQVAARAAKFGGRVADDARDGFAVADRALGVDVDANGHLRLHDRA